MTILTVAVATSSCSSWTTTDHSLEARLTRRQWAVTVSIAPDKMGAMYTIAIPLRTER